MFLRITKAKNNNYVSIVKAYRGIDGKPKQKIVKNLGSFKTEEERERLYILGTNLIKSMEGEILFTGKDIKELRRENYGASAVFDRLFEIYKLEKYINKLTQNRKIEYDLVSALKFMIAIRHCEPMSKLASFNKRHHFSGFGMFDLQHLYRSLDELHNYQNELREHIFNCQKAFSENKIDIVFFDVTTLYFESKNSDSLRDFGFSKDCKFNEVQVVLSLMITNDGMPIGYELFPGNQYEGGTLLSCLKLLRERYQIRKVIIVADRGLSSFENLQTIKENGFEYIIASRLGNLSKSMQEQILDNSGYQQMYAQDDDMLCYKTIHLQRKKRYKREMGQEEQILLENLLCIYSTKRARKDALDRKRLVQKAEEILNMGINNDKRGAKKYLKIEKREISGLDLEKIQNAERYDGFYIISYSDPKLDPKTVVSTYHGLWRIEASFRCMKHFFEARPVFHWSAKRISGHVMLNFICLVFEHFIYQAVRHISDITISEQAMRKALSELQRSVIEIQGKESFLYAPITDHQSIILKALNVKQHT